MIGHHCPADAKAAHRALPDGLAVRAGLSVRGRTRDLHPVDRMACVLDLDHVADLALKGPLHLIIYPPEIGP